MNILHLVSIVVSGVLCRFKVALPSLLFRLYIGQNRGAQHWLRLITGITVSLRRLRCEYFEKTREAVVLRKVLVKMNLTLDCSMIKATTGTVNFAACGNYRPHFTKITKIWQDRSPIRKSSIILRSRKTLFILLYPLLFNPASQNFLYGLCG